MRTCKSISIVLLTLVALGLGSCAGPHVQEALTPGVTAREGKPLRYEFRIGTKKEPIHVEETDTNGDGVLDHFTIHPGPSGESNRSITQGALQKDSCKRLILCMDSVPFGTMKRLWAEGYFREFYPPSAMISTFPSMTFLSFTDMFRTSKAISYEESYFDRKANKVAGGMGEHLHKDRIAEFYKRFDYQTPGIQGGTIYIAPKEVSAEDFNGMKESFKLLRSRQEVLAYVGGTDGLAHKLGEEGLADFLKNVDLALREVFLDSPEPLRIAVLSDHGNNYVPSRRLPLDEFFKKFLGIKELDKRLGLKGRPSVILPAYGLVNFAVVYTEDGREEKLAEFLATIEGVHFSLFSRNGAALIWGRKGKARIVKKPTADAYKYEQEAGDPLELAPVVQALKQAGKLDAEGYATDKDWYEATKEHKYIDAIHRLYEAATDLVENRASLIVDIEDGYYYGAKFFDAFCKLKGTHGSLKRESTLGFVMTNYKTLPPYLRSSEMADVLDLVKGRPVQVTIERELPPAGKNP